MNVKSIIFTTVLAGMIAPVFADPTPYCVAVGGGFGSPSQGASFVARNFSVPDPNKCSAWTGYTKFSASVIATTIGTACLSDDGSVMTLSLTSQDPNYFGVGRQAVDYISFCPQNAPSCIIGGGTDNGDIGSISGFSAEQQDCTDQLLDLPTLHD